MLQPSAVSVDLLRVLTTIQEQTAAAGFGLAGGTSLALRLGHRLSVDLDFFTTTPFDPPLLAEQFSIHPESITGQAEGTLQCLLQGVKVEFLRHAYPKLAEYDSIQGISMWSLSDVAAMKINAICNRGSKKDFYDLAALLEIHPLEHLLQQYKAKYRPATLLMAIRSLAWFEDADDEPDPISLRHETWPQVVHKISSAIRTLQ